MGEAAIRGRVGESEGTHRRNNSKLSKFGQGRANRGAVKEQETGWQICISFKVRHAKGCHMDGGKRGSLGNPHSGWKARTRSRNRPAYVPTMAVSLCPF